MSKGLAQTFVQRYGQMTGLPWWLGSKQSTCQSRRPGFDPWVRKIPWKRKWQPTPVFLPGKSHGQRSLVDYSPRGLKELDMTERLTHTHAFINSRTKLPVLSRYNFSPSPIASRLCCFVSGIGCLQKTLCLSSLWPFGVTFTCMTISILFLIIKGPMVSTYFYTLLHEFSYNCMPSWQVRSISFEKVCLSTAIFQLAIVSFFPSSHSDFCFPWLPL